MQPTYQIVALKTESMITPLGLDCHKPRFSWQMGSQHQGKRQTAYQISVRTGNDKIIVWDSGRVACSRSDHIEYCGSPLAPCVRYGWTVEVWDEAEQSISASSWFETGLMNPAEEAWEGAKWIGPVNNTLAASTKGIFWIESTFRITEGTCGGIVFGANDHRLNDKYKNTFLIQGPNYISYQIDISTLPAKLFIYRVGYRPGDSIDVPMAAMDIRDYNNPDDWIITEENKTDFHTLAVEVTGNRAKAYVDGHLVDVVEAEVFFRPGLKLKRGRQLNPAGDNDLITYPRLNEIGFSVPQGSNVQFKELKVRDVREPKAVVFYDAPACADRIFEGLPVEGGCYSIGGETVTADPSRVSIPMLRRSFQVAGGKKLADARLYVTARGIYEGHINGEKLSEDWFQPGASQYDKHLYYQTYDLTRRLTPGENAVGFYLASGWWSDSQTFALENYNFYGDRPSILAKIVLRYEDGSRETVVTDTDSWKYTGDGPVLYASFFHGEHIDARREAAYKDFATASYNDNEWGSPAEIAPLPIPREEGGLHMWPCPNYTSPEIIGQTGDPVRAVRTIKALSATEPRPGIHIYDMGQNMAGVPRIKLKGAPGQLITLRYCEILYPALDEYGELHGLPLMENLRDASCTDFYICKGDPEGEWFMPRFTFHGYRYVEITGTDTPPAVGDVEGIVLSSITALSGGFECSDPLVNKLFENITWSQLGNFISIPTDCPQRNERMGWMGDAQVFAQTATYNGDVRLFFSRYLQAVRDLQSQEGQYPNIAPLGGGFGGIAWEIAGIVIPWEVYRQYGDLRVVQDNYQAMAAYMDFLDRHYKNGALNGVGMLGDWLATEMGTDNDLVWHAIYAYASKIMAFMAKAIGNTADQEKYDALFYKLQGDWNNNFIDPVTGKTRAMDGTINDTQCSYALPLAYGVVSPENAGRAAGHLNRKTQELGHTLTTGFLGTAPINPALTEYGYGDTAYALLRQTQYPSWLYSVTQGATTIWERWNSYTVEAGFGGNNSMNSFNHYSLGAVGAWIYTHVLGIRPDESQPGYHRFIIKPYMGSLSYARGYYDSPYGRIESGWSIEGDKITLDISIPANTQATVYLPLGQIDSGISIEAIQEDDWQKIALPSGRYQFTIQSAF